ncbi:MAG: YiiX/YebB-like N1pC/P60 family cysteine hydrolase [Bacteroidales bacterium]
MMMKFASNVFLCFCFSFLFLFNGFGQTDTFELQTGDLLFQDLDCGPFCDAVEKVTIGYNGAKFSHVGIAVRNKTGNIEVIEAVGKGVCITALKDFLAKSSDTNKNPKVMVGRLKSKYRHLIPKAIEEAYKLIGRPYDEVFCISNNSYYCSELIYDIFKKANNNHAVFKIHSMTFKDPETGKTFAIWLDYFKELNKPIPEGELGNNAGGLSLSKKIEVVHFYGIPSGYKKTKTTR